MSDIKVWKQINIKISIKDFIEIKKLIRKKKLKEYQFYGQAIREYFNKLEEQSDE